MHFNLLLPSAVDADWERIGALLQPAIAHDRHMMAIEVYAALMRGRFAFFDIDLYEMRGAAVLEIGERVATVVYVAGRIGGRGRVWLARVRLLMQAFCDLVRRLGCTEMRLEGRDWGRVFPDWERLAERPGRHELRKVL